jgi:hypothetical protein
VLDTIQETALSFGCGGSMTGARGAVGLEANVTAGPDPVGLRGAVLSCDLGQVFSSTVGDAMREYFSKLQNQRIKEDDVTRMAVLNPNRLLFEHIGRGLVTLSTLIRHLLGDDRSRPATAPDSVPVAPNRT